ncbi:hypothetical protein JL720_3900 [Aureococcus anophagefferens]|nr:hypothetical protein JL720_3900 [Aureococcus anophagefferens]
MGEASAHAEVVVRSRGWVTGRISYLPAVATLRDGELRVVSHASRRGGRPAYDKTMAVPRARRRRGPARRRTRPPPRRRRRKPKVRELDCRTGAGVAFWESAIEDAQRAPAARRARGAAAADGRQRQRAAGGAGARGAPAARAAPRVGRARAAGAAAPTTPSPRTSRPSCATSRFASLGRSVAYSRGGGVASVGDAALALVAVNSGCRCSAVVCDLLAALCKEKEGLRVVDAVLDRVDGAARFGDAALASARRSRGAGRRDAPPRRRFSGPAQRARRRRAARRGGRAALRRDLRRGEDAVRGASRALYCAANAVVASRQRRGAKATLAKSASRDRAPAARRRRAPPTCAARGRGRRGRARSTVPAAPRDLASARRRGPGARALGAAADAFLGACDARERDEAADCDAAAPGGERRGQGQQKSAPLLADRDAAAWLAGDARADGVLRALGEDLEADRASLGPGGGRGASAATRRGSRALRAMDGDLVFGDGLADLDARMTRTVADRRARASGAASRSSTAR